MDPETRELATAAVEALQIMAANSSNRLGDIVGLVQYRPPRWPMLAPPYDNKERS